MWLFSLINLRVKLNICIFKKMVDAPTINFTFIYVLKSNTSVLDYWAIS